MAVVFPAPFGPRSPRHSLASTPKVRLLTMCFGSVGGLEEEQHLEGEMGEEVSGIWTVYVRWRAAIAFS